MNIDFTGGGQFSVLPYYASRFQNRRLFFCCGHPISRYIGKVLPDFIFTMASDYGGEGSMFDLQPDARMDFYTELMTRHSSSDSAETPESKRVGAFA
jgi:hypothetical protein